MKIVAYVPLHYGAEYLRNAIESVADFADRVIILYTDRPSYGHGTTLPCPDSEEELRACCEPFKDRLIWHRGRWGFEGEHRNTVFQLAPDADLVLPIDADEVWDRKSLDSCIAQAGKSTARNFLIKGWHHFWRSFEWSCEDVWAPVRIVNPRGEGSTTLDGTIYHFGYAQREQIVSYKWTCHGHQNELRPEWLNDIFLPNRRTDCHPIVKDWWNARPFEKSMLPDHLKANPNFAKDVIR